MKIENLRNKSILILGLGREGISTLKFLAKNFPGGKIAIADQLPEDKISKEIKNFIQNGLVGESFFGKDYLDKICKFDVIIKSPGISPHQKNLREAYKSGKVISGTCIFAANCPGMVVGVTGTKGKSTTASIIFEVLKNGGLDVKLVGNIGIPVLDCLDKDNKDKIYVFEMSSHQLLDLRQSPHIAVMTNLYPEHLDYYLSLEGYKQAKFNITRFQGAGDFFIFNQGEKELVDIANSTEAKLLPFSLEKLPNSVVFKSYDKLVYHNEEIIDKKDISLLGEFNLQNIMPAIIIGKLFEISTEKIKEAIKNFKPLPHRLEFIGIYQRISFYDDSISTIPQTAVAAITALGDKVETLIAGGYDRGIDFTPLAKKIKDSEIKNLILFPTTGERIWKAVCRAMPKVDLRPRKFDVSSMKEVVSIAFENTGPGKICLLSPASSSFNLFKNYEERGNLFKKYVQREAKS